MDPATFTIRLDGRSCVLRNTKEFAFFAALARRPGTYVAVDVLLDEVWNGEIRSTSAVKSVASSLRKLLMEAGLHEVTIDGRTNRHHYALIVDSTSRSPSDCRYARSGGRS